MICHYLTVLRVALTPVIIHIYLNSRSTLTVLILAFICEITDLLDGFFARRNKKISIFGTILDPIADSIWHTSIMLAFAYKTKVISLWIPLFIMWRDSLMSMLRILHALRGTALGAQKHGKIKSALIGISILLFLFGSLLIDCKYLNPNIFYSFITVFFNFICFLSWYTFVKYLFISRMLLKGFF